MITELTMENFRGFSSLELKDLKRVNVVVGQNNSGKTSLLEGILLLCEPTRIHELANSFRPAQGSADIRYFRWLLRDRAPGFKGELRGRVDGKQSSVLLTGKGYGNQTSTLIRRPGFPDLDSPQNLQGVIHTSSHLRATTSGALMNMRCRIISVQQREPSALVSLVGKAQRKAEGEDTLQNLLASLDPRIKKVRIDPGEDGNQVIVDIGLSELLPVSLC